MFAHIAAGTIVALGAYPDLEWDGVRWWDLRDPDIRAARGWLEVATSPRPADTEVGTYEGSVQIDETGQPVQVWTFRPWTPGEITAQAEADREATLRGTLTAGIAQAVTRRQAIVAGADALEAEVASLASVSLAAVKGLGSRVVTLARATAQGQQDTIALARLTVRALDSTDT